MDGLRKSFSVNKGTWTSIKSEERKIGDLVRGRDGGRGSEGIHGEMEKTSGLDYTNFRRVLTLLSCDSKAPYHKET